VEVIKTFVGRWCNYALCLCSNLRLIDELLKALVLFRFLRIGITDVWRAQPYSVQTPVSFCGLIIA